MGKTILISSHILHELAELCNVVGIIERGKLLFSGSVDEILRKARVGHVLHIGVAERTEQAAEVLAKAPGVEKVGVVDDPSLNGAGRVIHVNFNESQGGAASDLPNILINHGYRLTHFQEEAVNLETAFMRLTKGLVQ